jgi:hypothetical protein
LHKPFELLNGVLTALNRQVSDQFPVDFLPVFRRSTLLGMDYCQSQRGVAFLLPDRRQKSNLAVFKLNRSLG